MPKWDAEVPKQLPKVFMDLLETINSIFPRQGQPLDQWLASSVAEGLLSEEEHFFLTQWIEKMK